MFYNEKYRNLGKATGNKTQYTYEYLAQLLKDKKQLEAFPNVFHHLDRLAEEGVYVIFQSNKYYDIFSWFKSVFFSSLRLIFQFQP